jgi:hypothetical protein
MTGALLLVALGANALTLKQGTELLPAANRSVSALFNEEARPADARKSPKAKTISKLPAASRAALKTPKASEGFNPIYEAPEGKEIKMTGASMSFYVDWGEVNAEEWTGLAYDAVQTDNGEFYLKNPISFTPTDTYIKGRVTEEGLEFDFPQPLVRQFNNGEIYDFYADILEYAEVEDPDQGWIVTFLPSEERTLRFYRNDDGSYTMDEQYMLGLTYNNVWEGFGEMGLTLTEFEGDVAEMPADIELDYSYVLVDEQSYETTLYRPLAVALDGEDAYINGISLALPDAVVKGKVDMNAGTISIPSDQLLGRYHNYYLFLMTGDGYTYYDPDWEENMVSFDIMEDDLVFKYDAEKKTLMPIVAEEGHNAYLIINFGNTITSPCEYYCVDRIMDQGAVTDFTPQMPEIIAWNPISEFDPEYSYAIEFNLSGDNTAGQMLLDNNIYYCVYINGELYPLTVDEFPGIGELAGVDTMTYVPAAFSDDVDIYAWGAYHGLAFRNQEIETIGVQSVYIIDGEVMGRSKIATVDVSGVDETMADSETISTEYYDLTGRKVINPSAGSIVISRAHKADGSVKVAKQIVK